MEFDAFVKSLEQNASTVRPIAVEVAGIGTLYVRKRTVLEYEQMSDVRKAFFKEETEGEEESPEKKSGILAASVVRLLCKEDGTRYEPLQEQKLAALFAKQPDDVFHALINAADGKNTKEIQEGK